MHRVAYKQKVPCARHSRIRHTFWWLWGPGGGALEWVCGGTVNAVCSKIIVKRDNYERGCWRTVTPESWDRVVCTAGKSCAEPDTAANAITQHANNVYLRDDACHLLTIQKE